MFIEHNTTMVFNKLVFHLLCCLFLFWAVAVQAKNSCMKKAILTLVKKGHRLKNCIIFETDETWSLLDCSHMCMKQQPQCRSINFAKTQSRCQLNNQTKGAKASDLILDTDFNYYEQISIPLQSSTGVIIAFEGTYKIRNVRTQRLMFSNGYEIVGTDHNYYNRAFWKIINDRQGRYLFENVKTGKYLYSGGDEISGRGCEGVAAEAPLCLGSDSKDDDRALWRIVDNGDGEFFIESVVNLRYVFSQGEPPVRSHEGFANPPKCVMSDENYEDRAAWKIVKH